MKIDLEYKLSGRFPIPIDITTGLLNNEYCNSNKNLENKLTLTIYNVPTCNKYNV